MAYDDDGDRFGWRDFEGLATVLEQYSSAPENVAVTKLNGLVRAVHAVAGGRAPGEVGLDELAVGLRVRGLGGVAFDTVIRVMEAVAPIDSEADALDSLTLRDAQRILQR